MKKTEDKERVKRTSEEATVIYLTCLLKPPVPNLLEAPSVAPRLL